MINVINNTYILINNTIFTERAEQQKVMLKNNDIYRFFKKYCNSRYRPHSTKSMKKILGPIPNQTESLPARAEHTRFKKDNIVAGAYPWPDSQLPFLH